MSQNPQGQMLPVARGLHHYCIHHHTAAFENRRGDGTLHRLRRSFIGRLTSITLLVLKLCGPLTLNTVSNRLGAKWKWLHSNLTTDQYNELSDATMDAMLDSLEALVDESGQQEYEIEYSVRPVHFCLAVLCSLLAMRMHKWILATLPMGRHLFGNLERGIDA